MVRATSQSKQHCFVFGITVAIICLVVLIRCTQTGGLTPLASQPPASLDSQLAGGAPIYVQTCATSTCHGTHGEGIRSGNSFSMWPLVGTDFQSRHPNAEIVFDVVRSGDEPNLQRLTDQQIYDAIAYELRENQIALRAPLTAANAFITYGGTMSGEVQNGLFPPSDNVVMRGIPPTRRLPLAAENGRLRMQVDQIAEAGAIGNSMPPAGGAFLILVVVMTDIDQAPFTVSPDDLRLSTPTGDLLRPQSIDPHSAIEKFHLRTIDPQHGVAALLIFTLPAAEQFDQLVYEDQAGNRLVLALRR
jgi:hypothetical protein